MDHYRRSALNFFAAHDLDRASVRRQDSDWLRERLRDPVTRIVPVHRQRSLLHPGDPPRPVLLSAVEIADRLDLGPAILLGESAGTAYFALELPGDALASPGLLPDGAELHELRDAGGWLEPQAGALLAYARALTYWQHRHRHCGQCGAPTRALDGGHLLECSAAGCAAKHFPRTDPAVIVLVTAPPGAGGEDRCLLGRQPVWPAGMYSTVAGFVEPGESIEDAVVREVREETGIAVAEAHYHSSQPWPFPSSLMLGFTARAASQDIVRHDEELEDARWFTRDEIAAGLAAGTLRVPRRVSIAYRLVEDWFDAGDRGRLSDHLR